MSKNDACREQQKSPWLLLFVSCLALVPPEVSARGGVVGSAIPSLTIVPPLVVGYICIQVVKAFPELPSLLGGLFLMVSISIGATEGFVHFGLIQSSAFSVTALVVFLCLFLLPAVCFVIKTIAFPGKNRPQ